MSKKSNKQIVIISVFVVFLLSLSIEFDLDLFSPFQSFVIIIVLGIFIWGSAILDIIKLIKDKLSKH